MTIPDENLVWGVSAKAAARLCITCIVQRDLLALPQQYSQELPDMEDGAPNDETLHAVQL